jgi:dipeptidase D
VGVPDPFEALEPAGVWRRFGELTRIPRASRHEEAAVAHVLAWARGHGYPARQDARGNVLVEVPATRRRSGAPTVVLQAHLDMVCEREPGSENDAAEGRIEVVRDGDWLRADGTTLGADDGIGVAAMLALGDEAPGPHGPLELLFTLTEELGLEGALELDRKLVSGRILLNLDSDEDGTLTIGCAGSTTSRFVLAFGRDATPEDAAALEVSVTGGLGGHSGMDAHLGRANAIRAIARILTVTAPVAELRLAWLEGGRSRNAIPREASAIVLVRADRAAVFRNALDAAFGVVRAQVRGADDGIALSVAPAERPANAWSQERTSRILSALVALPNGVLAVSRDLPGLVETSSNIGVVSTVDDRLAVTCLTRTSNDPALGDVLGSIRAVAELAGGEYETVSSYSGWRPDPETIAVTATRAAFTRLFGHEPRVAGVHAGVEPAAIGARVPGMSMVSFGPTVTGLHAPGERIEIPTVERFWRLLAATLDELSRPPKSRRS